MRTLIERLTSIRNDLARVASDGPTMTKHAGTADYELERMLDSIVENAVHVRGVIEHGLDAGGVPRAGATRLFKRVRKALGYTYP